MSARKVELIPPPTLSFCADLRRPGEPGNSVLLWTKLVRGRTPEIAAFVQTTHHEVAAEIARRWEAGER